VRERRKVKEGESKTEEKRVKCLKTSHWRKEGTDTETDIDV